MAGLSLSSGYSRTRLSASRARNTKNHHDQTEKDSSLRYRRRSSLTYSSKISQTPPHSVLITTLHVACAPGPHMAHMAPRVWSHIPESYTRDSRFTVYGARAGDRGKALSKALATMIRLCGSALYKDQNVDEDVFI